MTLHASRNGQEVTIHGNIHLDLELKDGLVRQFSVTEDAAHVRSFHKQLGELLDKAQEELRGDSA